MDLLGYIILTVFCFIGLLQSAKFVSLKLTQPKSKCDHILLYPVKDGIEDIEMIIRFIHNQSKWDCYEGDTVFVLDLGLDDESKRIAKVLSLELDGVEYCTPESLMDKINIEVDKN